MTMQKWQAEILDHKIQQVLSIEKSVEIDIEKSKSGIYANTSENRRLGRVGQKFGKEGNKEENEAKNKQQEKDTPNITIGKLQEQRKKLVKRNGLLSSSRAATHNIRMEIQQNSKLINEIDTKLKHLEKVSKAYTDSLNIVEEAIKNGELPEFILEKGKKANVGEERKWGNNTYKKTPNGWVFVSQNKEGGKKEEGKEKGKSELPKRIETFLSQFPDNATKWGQATDEVRDMARLSKEYYNEMDLDVLADDPKALKPLDFKALKTPSEWNTKGKKYIRDTFNKMSSNTQKEFGNRVQDLFVGKQNEESQVDYFIDKFSRKMSDSTVSGSAWWIDGISELSDKEKKQVWDKVKHLTDTKSRDRQMEHNDLPTWLKKDKSENKSTLPNEGIVRNSKGISHNW